MNIKPLLVATLFSISGVCAALEVCKVDQKSGTCAIPVKQNNGIAFEEYKDGKKTGTASVIYDSGSRYEGDFTNGFPNGKGVLTLPNGAQLIGQFINGKFTGSGKLLQKDGGVFEGNFLDGKLNGTGKATLANGAVFSGNFVEGDLTGAGVVTLPNGVVFTGTFTKGKLNGDGTLTLSDGKKYVGEFKDNSPNGRGVEYSASGSVLRKGIWDDGKLVSPEKNQIPQKLEKVEPLQPVVSKSDISDSVPIRTVAEKNYIAPINSAIKIVKVDPPGMFDSNATVTLENKSTIPYVVQVDIHPSSSSAEVLGSESFTISGSTKKTIKIAPLPGKKFGDQLFAKGKWKIGDGTVAKVSSGYRLPFEQGVKVEICQSEDGPITSHIDTPEAYDMCAPIGTKVVAAKPGIVIFARNDSTDGGVGAKYKEKANEVKILQTDGSIAVYAHFKTNSVRVKEGDVVSTGSPLAEIGMTGWTSGPHLHFHVFYADDSIREVQVKPEFETSSGKPIPLLYKSIVTSDGVEKKASPKPDSKPSSVPTGNANCNNPAKDPVSRGNDCFVTANYAEAVTVLSQYVRGNPNNKRALALLGFAYFKTGENELAVQSLKKAIANGANTYDVYAYLGFALEAQGKDDEAISMYKKSISINPRLVDVTQKLSKLYLSKGMKSEALALLVNFDQQQRKAGKSPYFENEIKKLQ